MLLITHLSIEAGGWRRVIESSSPVDLPGEKGRYLINLNDWFHLAGFNAFFVSFPALFLLMFVCCLCTIDFISIHCYFFFSHFFVSVMYCFLPSYCLLSCLSVFVGVWKFVYLLFLFSICNYYLLYILSLYVCLFVYCCAFFPFFFIFLPVVSVSSSYFLL